MCATIRKRTHQNTIRTRLFLSYAKKTNGKNSSSNNNNKSNQQPNNINENKYLLHSFKHVFLLFVAPFFFAFTLMLKNRISFDNATHWIPTRCEDVTRTERFFGWISRCENKFSIQTYTRVRTKKNLYTYLFCARMKELDGNKAKMKEENMGECDRFFSSSSQFEWQWNKFNLIRNSLTAAQPSWAEIREAKRSRMPTL